MQLSIFFVYTSILNPKGCGMMKKYPDGSFGIDNSMFDDPIRLLTIHREYRNLTEDFYEDDDEDYFERDID